MLFDLILLILLLLSILNPHQTFRFRGGVGGKGDWGRGRGGRRTIPQNDKETTTFDAPELGCVVPASCRDKAVNTVVPT